MYRYKLEEIGVDQTIRIIAQYKHIAYGRLLLLNVTLLDDFLSFEPFDNDIAPEQSEILTDHVHLDISHTDDKRLTRFREQYDIVICTCEIYQYEYTNHSYGCFISNGKVNYGLKDPTDITLLRPLIYDNHLLFFPKPSDKRVSYWRYVGRGSRGCIPDKRWDFTNVEILARKHESINWDETITQYDGYEVTNETESTMELFYEKHDSKLIVYKSINGYFGVHQ